MVERKTFNLRDSDIAGRTTCTDAKLKSCQTPLKCIGCLTPQIEKRLAQWNIEHQGLDLFPERNDGYDLADAIRDGLRPNIMEFAISEAMKAKPVEAESNSDNDDDYIDYHLADFLPKGVELKEVMEYGFYEDRHRYYIQRKGYEFEKVSNFTMKVLFLIKGVHAKRIVEIENVYKKKAVIDMDIADLISLDKFKVRIESVGNFQFDGKATDLSRIKNKLFNLEKASQEISVLGQYKDEL